MLTYFNLFNNRFLIIVKCHDPPRNLLSFFWGRWRRFLVIRKGKCFSKESVSPHSFLGRLGQNKFACGKSASLMPVGVWVVWKPKLWISLRLWTCAWDKPIKKSVNYTNILMQLLLFQIRFLYLKMSNFDL